MQQLLRAGVQAKLTTSQPGDADEQEADRVADRVTSGIGPGNSHVCRTCLAGAEPCPRCEEERVQRKVADGSASKRTQSWPLTGTAGQPLTPHVRSFLEPRFGYDFSAVRLHTGARASQSAASLGARAFTLGSDITFGDGEFAPETSRGMHLLAHELTHVIQQSVDSSPGRIARQASPQDSKLKSSAGPKPENNPDADVDEDSDGIPGADVAPPKEPQPTDIPLPEPNGEVLGEFEGVTLVDDRDYMFAQLERLAAKDGTYAPGAWGAAFEEEINREEALSKFDPNDVDGIPPPPDERIGAKKHVLFYVDEICRELEQMADSFLAEFEQRARDTALEILKKNQEEAEAEAFRYGITSETHKEQTADCMIGDCEHDVTTYSMGQQSSAVSGLQAAAKILLPKRRALDAAKSDLDHARWAIAACDYGCDDMDTTAEEEALEKAASQFQLLLGFLGQKYPILNAFADPDHDADDLEALSKSPQSSPSLAKLLGPEIFNRLKNIKTVKENINDLNIWQLPMLVGLVRTQTEGDTHPFFKRVADEVVDYNKPGWLETIALLVLNLGAILLAGPTGGASLAVAAVVNAGVAIEHTKDYVMKKALAGTAFDKAKGLSMEDPSLFWLAVEWIGVGLDVGAAFKAVSAAVKTAEVAMETADTAKQAKALSELDALAKDAKTQKVVAAAKARLLGEVSEEKIVLEAVGMGERDVSLLAEAEQAAQTELKLGSASGKAMEESVVANAKISRAGHIFSCASPCIWMREKYAAVIGPELVDKQPNLLREQFLKLEERATKAAEAADFARKAGKAEEIAKAEKVVDDLEREIGEFDKKLAQELNYRKGLEKLTVQSTEQGERLALMDREMVKRLAELKPAAAKAMLELAPDQLAKLGTLSAEEFGKIAKLGKQGIAKLAKLEPTALAKMARLEGSKLAYVTSLSSDTVDWLSKLSPEALEKIAAARITSPFSLRRMAEKIGPKTSMKEVESMIAKAERHQAQLEKAFEAMESGDWSKIPDKDSVGRHLGYEIEEIAKGFGASGYADEVLHYAQVDKKLIAELEKGQGRALITQGQLKGGDLRFDIALVDFEKKSVELIDLVPKGNKLHIEKTQQYIAELKKLLPKDFSFVGTEMRYVDAEGKVVETLEESVVAK